MATVLYVDDEAVIRRAVRAWLAREGHLVHEAANLAEARHVIMNHALDGVLIDLWLGNESGLALLAWIDDLDAALARRVAFVSGDLFAEDHFRLAQRFDHPVYLKPFPLRDLSLQVAAWARERRADEHDPAWRAREQAGTPAASEPTIAYPNP